MSSPRISTLKQSAESDLPGKFLTLSNLLSLSRIALVLPFVLVMGDPQPMDRVWGAAIMAFAALTDKLDGYFARRLHQTSEWGRILDPLADKIAVGAVIVVLFVNGSLPLWFLLLGLGRDLVILSGGLIIRKMFGVLLPSNEMGKWTVGIISLALVTLILWPASLISDILLAASAVMMLLSLVSYGTRGVEIIREQGRS